MPSDKHNLMAIATGLISSLFDVASSKDMPFCQPQQLHACIMALPKLTFILQGKDL